MMMTVRTIEEEAKKLEQIKAKEEYKKLDKASVKVADIVKRIEAIENILNI